MQHPGGRQRGEASGRPQAWVGLWRESKEGFKQFSLINIKLLFFFSFCAKVLNFLLKSLNEDYFLIQKIQNALKVWLFWVLMDILPLKVIQSIIFGTLKTHIGLLSSSKWRTPSKWKQSQTFKMTFTRKVWFTTWMHDCMEEKWIFLYLSVNLSSILSSSILCFSTCIYHTFLLSLHIFPST